MATRIRLRRVGRKKLPLYRIVVADQESPRDGRFIEIIGTYNPKGETAADKIQVDGEKILLNGKPVFLRGISLHEEEFGINPVRNITPEASRALLSEIKYIWLPFSVLWGCSLLLKRALVRRA